MTTATELRTGPLADIRLDALRRLWRTLGRDLFPVPSTDRLFNQYRDDVPGIDRRGGAAARRRNLRSYLASFNRPPLLLVVGEGIGYQGGRFSGVALTSERMIANGALDYPAVTTSRQGPYIEPTATILWGELKGLERRVMTWNAVPLHPHFAGRPLTNRTPSVIERRFFLPVLQAVYSQAEAKIVVALGNHAHLALSELGITHVKVRHPANGGATAFRQGIASVVAQLREMVPADYRPAPDDTE